MTPFVGRSVWEEKTSGTFDWKVYAGTSAICPVNRFLFDGTLASNLRLVRPSATEHDLDEAIRNVGLSSFVANPAGWPAATNRARRLPTFRGTTATACPRKGPFAAASAFSFWTKRRSCLDAPGEAAVLENIQRHLRASTLVVVSHRLSTFAAFERVLILSGGRIVNDCRPDVIMRPQNAYATFAVSDTAIPANSLCKRRSLPYQARENSRSRYFRISWIMKIAKGSSLRS